jgi:hypothetical protein
MMNLSGIPRLLKNFGQSTVDDAGRLFQHWGKNAQSLAKEIPHAAIGLIGDTTPINPNYLDNFDDLVRMAQPAIERTYPFSKPIDSAFKFLI